MKYRDPVVAGPLMSDMKFKKKTPRFRIEVGGGGRGRGVWIPTPSIEMSLQLFAAAEV